MFEIEIELNFSAAHYLREYKGKCESLHGHNWKVKVSVCSSGLNKIGMVADFSELKNKTKDILAKLDHCNLNEIDYFKKVNPTSENIAKFIFDELDNLLDKTNCTLNKVTVWETDTSSASYFTQ